MKTAFMVILSSLAAVFTQAKQSADVIIYGGTSAGVIAAVQAKQMGKSVIIVSPDKRLGGLSSGGLGWTDTGKKEAIGGLSRDFYHRIWKKYQEPETWKFQKMEDYGGRGQGTPAIDGANRTMWIFEPSVAESVFEDYVKEFKIPVVRDAWLDRDKGVKKSDGRITSITTLKGETFLGKMFIDATYEGDLIASAGVDYHVGREGQEVYGERWNGVQTGELFHRHHFGTIKGRIDPYVVPGDPNSGVIARVSAEHPGEKHSGDNKVQAYCFRMCLTDDPENRIPFTKPEGYDPTQYELLGRIYAAGWRETFGKFDPIPNHKTDTNNHGPMSTDNIGFNYDYPEASYERRREIIAEHKTYQKGWLWFHCTDPRVPEDVREKMNTWGLPKDEYTEYGNWSPQLYIREARRMVGQFVMTENELLQKKPTPQSVGMGSYTIDSHNTQRYITPEGYVQNEGDIGVKCPPYQIAYGSLIPKKEQCENLLVPVCVSSSHIAFGSIRMEPVFMILGQSTATAACFAIDQDIAVQDLEYATLSERLLKDGQVLEMEPKNDVKGFDATKLKGIIVDDSKAKTTGSWSQSSAHDRFVGFSYRHDYDARDGLATAIYETTLPKAGSYEVRLGYTHNKNRSTKVKVTIDHAGGTETVTVNQRKKPAHSGLLHSLGKFEFDDESAAKVTVTNEGSDGYVVIDAVQFLP